MSGIVLPFPERPIVLAHGVLRVPHRHDDVELSIACSVLAAALRQGELVPPDTLDRLVILVLWGPGPLDLRLRLAETLAEIEDAAVQGRAVVQLRDPSTPYDRREIAARLLGGPRPGARARIGFGERARPRVCRTDVEGG